MGDMATYQSFGFDPLTTTLMRISSGPGLGTGESMILTEISVLTAASFMVENGWEQQKSYEKMSWREESSKIASILIVIRILFSHKTLRLRSVGHP